MAVRVGINGFGRIGRQVFKAIQERHASELEVVAINDLTDAKRAHLQCDSNYGRYPVRSASREGHIVDGKKILVHAEDRPALGRSGVQVVLESTGFFPMATVMRTSCRREEGAHRPGKRGPHGARRQKSMTPPAPDLNASCDNCLAPVAGPLDSPARAGLMNTIHSHTMIAHPGSAAQGSAPRPCRRAQHDPDDHGCRPRHQPGHPRA